jgi:hypothetical protein
MSSGFNQAILLGRLVAPAEERLMARSLLRIRRLPRLDTHRRLKESPLETGHLRLLPGGHPAAPCPLN